MRLDVYFPDNLAPRTPRHGRFGWACFLVALVFIGVLTALIGDLAGHMGCCMGLLPSVTAITFVALGTSAGRWKCPLSALHPA